eukprot:CAMPEP_0194139868 /NCGR_PEP_ID=MMETSP0152-20130528/9463_1 /TAXON_ID=1049557 /ORGANISM="Thalassiothrix antarctica, Strain L6-D1" /LENGTH=137 /DNA_ID=CAMNT_0038837849 /DNA_START=227 /DNA_END=637 /DNA_ORIENTATION=+
MSNTAATAFEEGEESTTTTTTTNNKDVGIKATFILPDGTTVVRKFDASNTSIPKLGEASTPEIGSYDFTGRHDQDVLPEPKEGGPIAQLIGCVTATKNFSNQYLTDIIKKEKCNHRTDNDNEKVLKKSREDESVKKT